MMKRKIKAREGKERKHIYIYIYIYIQLGYERGSDTEPRPFVFPLLVFSWLH
jgi:hypothetical protein